VGAKKRDNIVLNIFFQRAVPEKGMGLQKFQLRKRGGGI
jgi:hypothetical protein